MTEEEYTIEKEHELLVAYHQALLHQGVKDYPFETLYDHYIESLLIQFVIPLTLNAMV